MKRHRRHLPSILAALVAAGLSSLAADGARAELRPVFDELKLYNSPATLPTIEVEAEGQDWTKVSTETLHVTTNYYVSLRKGDIITISGIFDYWPIVQSRHPGGGRRRWGEFHFEIPNSQMGILKSAAIHACNLKKEAGARTDETHTAYVPVPFKLFVRAERAGNQSTKTVDGDVQAKVVCKQAPKQVEISHLDVTVDDSDKCPKTAVVQVGFNTNRDDRIDFTLEHMNRSLHTSEHFAQPFKIGGQYVATKRIEDLVVDSNTEYVLVRLKDGSDVKRWPPLGPGGRPQNPPITCPRAFKVTSAWLKYDVEKKLVCPKQVVETAKFKATAPVQAPFEIKTRAGLVVHSGTADFKLTGMEYVAEVKRPNLMMNAFDSDMMALIKSQPDANSGWVRLKVECLEVLSGTLDLREFASTRCEGEAALSVRTNMPGHVPYQLDCTGGRSWAGTVEAQKTGPDTYIGVDTKRFGVANNEQVNCALKTRAPMPVRVLALKGNTYECHRPSGAASSADLLPETRPDPTRPSRHGRVVIDSPPTAPSGPEGPGKVIDTGPRISCAGGVVRNRRCFCPSTHKAVEAGQDALRCIRAATADPPQKKRAQAERRRKAGPMTAASGNRKRPRRAAR